MHGFQPVFDNPGQNHGLLWDRLVQISLSGWLHNAYSLFLKIHYRTFVSVTETEGKRRLSMAVLVFLGISELFIIYYFLAVYFKDRI